MIFVHARNSTVRTATVLKDLAGMSNELHLFTDNQHSAEFGNATKNVSNVIESVETVMMPV